MVLLPSSTAIQHIYWEFTVDDNGNPVLDSHGNPTGAYGPPVNETCICWWPLERRTWEQDTIDPNLVNSYENDLHLLVNDPSIFTKLDRVIVNGLMYQVEGLSTDWAAGLPFPTAAYGALVGGEVHVRRVSDTAVLAGE
jgi:hypothetical protein